jgi:mannose-6-phosphate isomerase-like protein (cupin superfamily)
METTILPLVLASEAVAALPVEPLGRFGGVRHRVMWRDGLSMAGVMHVDGGYRLGTHAHRVNHHHMWVIEGRAVIVGAELDPGSYVHIPSGVDHDVDATGTEGCAVFYVYSGPGS